MFHFLFLLIVMNVKQLYSKHRLERFKHFEKLIKCFRTMCVCVFVVNMRRIKLANRILTKLNIHALIPKSTNFLTCNRETFDNIY